MARKRRVREVKPASVERAARVGLPTWVAAIVLLVAIGTVYGRSLNAPFIFDDVEGIENNESITSLWPLLGSAEQRGPLNPRSDLPSSGRPLVNLSLAVNYHWGELRPFGYHLFSVAVHYLTAVLLYAVVRRTLNLPYFAGRFGGAAEWLALGVALLWALHPLQTEAVIYVTQRSELLVALFYLSTLYASLRYWTVGEDSRQRAIWLTLAVVASLAGMASKEIMVSAPLMVLLFERTFISGTIKDGLRRSWPLYVGLACTWLLLVALNISAPRGKSAGFGLGLPLGFWWLTQSQMLIMYLKLVVWPSPLLIHYRLPYLESLSQAWIYVVPVVALVVATLILLWRNRPAGYLLTWMLAILAPTSIIPILTEMAAERRMYLPLAAIAVLVVVGGYVLVQYKFKREVNAARRPKAAFVLPILALAIGLGLLSANRLNAYQDPKVLWQEVVQHQTQNALAHGNLGSVYAKSGHLPEAIVELEAAVTLDPSDHMALTNLGQALTDTGNFDEAISRLMAAVGREPNDALALNNLGVALFRAGRHAEAIEPLERAVRARPRFAAAHNSLGGALALTGRNTEAIAHFREALRLDPNLTMAEQNLTALESQSAASAEPTK